MDENFDLSSQSTGCSGSDHNDIIYDGFYWNDENTFDPDINCSQAINFLPTG